MDDADIAAARDEADIGLALRALHTPLVRRIAGDPQDRCLICDRPIPPARLALFPAGDCCTCVACQETLERGMGR